MKTQRLYWDDPYLQTWQSTVLARRADATELALDHTAFYPEGGGQPADAGSINGVAVLDVQSDGDLIWHTLATPLLEDAVHCELNWERRFDHMQQHHGQHLLSAAFAHVCDATTTAFHLGRESTTIDLDQTTLTEDQIIAVEEWVNQVIWADLPVLVRFVEPAELATLPLRKPPRLSGTLRVVTVEQVDYSACGGTHPHSTGAVGLLHIRRIEKRGAETRVEFLCGARALRDYRTKNAILGRIAQSFSVAVDATEAAIERLRDAETEARKGWEQAQKQLLGFEAATLLTEAPLVAQRPLICRAWDDRSADQLRQLAKHLVDQQALVLLGSLGPKAQLVFAGDHPQLDCGALLRQTTAAFAGRGGGSRTNAQGIIDDVTTLPAALDYACELLKNQLS